MIVLIVVSRLCVGVLPIGGYIEGLVGLKSFMIGSFFILGSIVFDIVLFLEGVGLFIV